MSVAKNKMSVVSGPLSVAKEQHWHPLDNMHHHILLKQKGQNKHLGKNER